ncbi:MAG TPA: PA2779 family protein [Thermoanaerobaculia bacterium]|nr:PA2779 family protein [Thermoanaerobaculia bacterium]
MRSITLPLSLAFMLLSGPLFAGPVPSKTVSNQDLLARDADLATVRGIVESDQVARALAEHGLTRSEIESRLAQLSARDLLQLAQNLDQIQEAGISRGGWIWMGIASVAPFIIVALAHSIGP